jgi:hypothetical protein
MRDEKEKKQQQQFSQSKVHQNEFINWLNVWKIITMATKQNIAAI